MFVHSALIVWAKSAHPIHVPVCGSVTSLTPLASLVPVFRKRGPRSVFVLNNFSLLLLLQEMRNSNTKLTINTSRPLLYVLYRVIIYIDNRCGIQYRR